MHRISIFFLACTIACCTQTICAQQNNHWYFGHNASIDLNGGVATPTTGALEALEGTSTISDASGDLLFYTEGTTIWDRNNNVMPNGSGLLGGASSTQAALVVPKPGGCGIFYVFTTQDHTQSGDFRYSVVDMCLNNGFGDVVTGEKNIMIHTPCSEKITAVPNTNGTDYWIISHELGGGSFLAYSLTSIGLNTTPVTSTVGSFHASNCMIGPLKASPNGQHLVCEKTFCSGCELFDFDPAAGVVSNGVDLMGLYGIPNGCYGAEFSPSGNLLYIATTWGANDLYQIDLLLSQSTLIASLGFGGYQLGGLQLGADGRIYAARKDQTFLDVIALPDVSGTGCGYLAAGFALAPGSTSDIGMPCVVPANIFSIPIQPIDLSIGSDTALCGPVPILLIAPELCGASYLWQNGSTNAALIAGIPGIYWVQVTNACGVGADTILIGDASQANAAFTATAIDGDPLTSQFEQVATVPGCNGVWDFGDSSAPGMGNSILHTFPGAGNYHVCFTVTCTCGNVVSYCEDVQIMAMGVPVITVDQDIRVIFQPISDQLLIQCGAGDRAKDVRVLDARGREMLVDQVAVGSVALMDASGLPNGVYLVRMRMSNGSIVGRKVAVIR